VARRAGKTTTFTHDKPCAAAIALHECNG